jgi:hypothetical protein
MEFGILYEQEGTCARRDAAPGVLEASAGPYAKVARKVEEDGPSIAIAFQEPVPFYGWYLKVCLACLHSHADFRRSLGLLGTILMTCPRGWQRAHTDLLQVARDTPESRQCRDALSNNDKVILSIPAVNVQPPSDPCPLAPQSPQGGADTSNFDIYAKNGDDGEWALVGRPSWRSDALNYQDLKNPRYDTHGTSFFMPKDQELTLFEPSVTQLNPPFPGPLFFYGLALLLFGIMGFLRLNNWAAVGFATVCIVALARENNIGNAENPNAHKTALCQNHFVLMLYDFFQKR